MSRHSGLGFRDGTNDRIPGSTGGPPDVVIHRGIRDRKTPCALVVLVHRSRDPGQLDHLVASSQLILADLGRSHDHWCGLERFASSIR